MHLLRHFPLFCLCTLLGWLSQRQPAPTPAQQLQARYVRDLDTLQQSVSLLLQQVEADAPADSLQHAYRHAKRDFKQVEGLVAYFFPTAHKALNGPPIPEVEAYDQIRRVQPPTGFQVVESLLFPYQPGSRDSLRQEVRTLQSVLKRLQHVQDGAPMTDAHLLSAMRQQWVRLQTLGLAGFDAAASREAIAETEAALAGMQEYLSPYCQQAGDSTCHRLQGYLRYARTYLRQHPDFEHFDRHAFLRHEGARIGEGLYTLQKQLGIPLLDDQSAVSPQASTLFQEDFFQTDFFAMDSRLGSTPQRVALGKMLFQEKGLSGQGKRSCASCHQPDKAFADGVRLQPSLRPPYRGIQRNTPTLYHVGVQPALFMDGRAGFLEQQISLVIANPEEMGGNIPEVLRFLNKQPAYRQALQQAFPQARQWEERYLQASLAAYLRSLKAPATRFDQHMRNPQAELLSKQEIRGFNLFMGKAQCATCHFAPLFGGSVPPAYTEVEAEVLGTPTGPDMRRLDKDPGKFALLQNPLHLYAFKTPNLKHVGRTAPYMHNGAFQTLEQVVEFYNRGGGVGLGLDVAHQTLPSEPLQLSAQEKQALVAFLRTL